MPVTPGLASPYDDGLSSQPISLIFDRSHGSQNVLDVSMRGLQQQLSLVGRDLAHRSACDLTRINKPLLEKPISFISLN
jgi:hypothetical protein